MSSVREFLGYSSSDGTLAHLGIDPATPDEWRTPDHCLTWLRERGYSLAFAEAVDVGIAVKFEHEIRRGYEDVLYGTGPTLHAALIAACRAVQEAS